MSNNISAWAIRNPVPVILLFLLLSFAGLAGHARLQVQNFPDFDLPTVTITAMLPGASPTQLENEVARKIEDALASVQGVRHIDSNLSDGVASIRVEFRLEKDTQEAVDDVRDAVARVRSDLPASLRDPAIAKEEFNSAPVLSYVIASSRADHRLDREALSWLVDDRITRALLAVRGVGAVVRVGGGQRTVLVELDPDRLRALGTTAAEISHQLRATRIEAAGGRVRGEADAGEQAVRIVAGMRSAAELGALDLALPDGRRIRLDQVATISDGLDEPRSAAFLDGVPAVGFDVLRARGFGEVEVATAVRAALAELRRQHPELALTETFNGVDTVLDNHRGSMRMLWEGAALAVLVVFLFLRDWRATLVAAVALPLSVVPTFALMAAAGFSLNTVTLLSLSLVVGVLVDDAIVEIENIERHLGAGKPPRQAAIDAAAEIGMAVLATTLTLVAVFLPTAFMGGIAGKFFVQFGWTAAWAVLFSLLVARLLTPMMAAALLRARPRSDGRLPEPAWIRLYLTAVGWCLRHRASTLAGAAALCAGGIWLASLLPAGFVPADDDDRTQVVLTLAPGSTIEESAALAEQARLLLRQHPHVLRMHTAIGASGAGATGSGPRGSGVDTAQITIGLTPRNERGGVRKADIEGQLRTALALLPGARVAVGAEGSGATFVVGLAGGDGALLALHAQTVQQALRRLPGVGAVTSSASLLQPELSVRPDFAMAADLGVTPAAIADTLRVATIGDYPQDLAKLDLGARQVPVVVRLARQGRDEPGALERLPVPATGGAVALGRVARIVHDSGPASITRRDRLRNVDIVVELGGRELGSVERAALALPSLAHLPPGVTLAPAGEAEEGRELAASFGLAMLTGVLCIYMVLVLLFKDFAQPVTILAALALSVPGAFLALTLSGAALSMPAMIGLVMLMGVAAKNAILLVDYIVIARRDHRLARMEATLDACRKRVRPIVMTTLAMGGGMVPVALGMGGDPSFRVPMALAVIGGLLSSTLLSLLVIPPLYTCVDDAVSCLRKCRPGRCRAHGAASAG